jgi:hypothetical protein
LQDRRERLKISEDNLKLREPIQEDFKTLSMALTIPSQIFNVSLLMRGLNAELIKPSFNSLLTD